MSARGTRADPVPVIAGCLAFALVLFLPPILNDGDTLWQISTGAWILDHRAIPVTDPFSFTAGHVRWFAHEWLAETLMALAFRAGGMPGVMVLTAAAVGATTGLLLRHLRQFLPGPYALAALAVALCNAAPSMLARPHLLAWPCLVLWCGGLVAARARRTAPSVALLPVMLLWVNLHGSFMLGLLLPVAFMIEALCDPGVDRRRVCADWAGFIAAAWMVALLNPDGLAGLLFPVHMLGLHSLAWIGEWEPADFSHFSPLEVTLLGGLALGLSGKARLPPVRLLLLLGLVHAALAHGRNEQLLGLVGVLVLAEPLGASLARDTAHDGASSGMPTGMPAATHAGTPMSSRTAWRRRSAAMLIALAALTLRMAVPLSPARTGATFAAMLTSVPASLRDRPVLNAYGLGGLLIFNGVRPFVDSRADLYGDAFLARYRRITAPDRAELARTLSAYDIAWTIFPSGHAVVAAMDQQPGWKRLVDANGIVIHVRQDWGRQDRLPGTAAPPP